MTTRDDSVELEKQALRAVYPNQIEEQMERGAALVEELPGEVYLAN